MNILKIKQNLKYIFSNLKMYISKSIIQLRYLFIFFLLAKSILFVTYLDYSISNLKDNLSYFAVYSILHIVFS